MKKLFLGLNMALLSLLAISCADKTPGAEGKPGTDGDIKTVQIDKQVWMAENMAVTTDAEGKPLALDTNYTVADGAYLYDWETAQRICPKGWHMPTKDEFTTLVKNAGFESGAELAGDKEAWAKDKMTESEHFGRTQFNALPTGYYFKDPANANQSKLYGKTFNANFWSATEGEKNEDPKKDNSNRANCLSINHTTVDASVSMVSKEFKMSVRCIRDKK
ncbi:MAG: hypothetical protein J6X65_00125 [Bacteroidales bacterium]|nr:hypothetical protein [Bacteroidales bacterium]